LYLFNKNEFSLFIKSDSKEVTGDVKMVDYAKKMFYNSVIAFLSGYILSIVISFTLSPKHIGAYNILLTLTGLTTFLLINLNKVFASAISKLYHENKISELNELYKRTTFFINIFTIPLAVIIAIFADEILGLYTVEMLNYKNYLFFMLLGGTLSLAAGSSGTFMIMAGLEKQNLYIQFIRALFLIVLSLSLIQYFGKDYGMLIIVILYVVFMLLLNVSQLFYIRKHINISPFSRELIVLFLLTFFAMYIAIVQNFKFEMIHYFIIPVVVYLSFFGIMFKPFKRIIKELL
jgi:O-antigen/teichoic acid export membrane protein